MSHQDWTSEFRRFLAKTRSEACRLGCSKVTEIHFLLVSVADDNEFSSKILKEELGERAFYFLRDRLEGLARGRVNPVKRSYPSDRWYLAIRMTESEKRIYRIERIHPELFLLGYLRSDDPFFLRGFLDFTGGSKLIHTVRSRLEESLLEREVS